ncbi:MAG: YoaK family protein [bacterium]
MFNIEERSYKENIKLAGLFSFNAGYTNALAFLVFGISVSHVTGNVTKMGFSVSKLAEIATRMGHKVQDLELATQPLSLDLLILMTLVVVSFISGAFLGTVLMRKAGFCYALILEGFFFFAITAYSLEISAKYLNVRLIYPAILAVIMGCQNAVTSYISSSVVRTTHLTGCSTDIGMALGMKDYTQFVLMATVFVGFLLGAVFGYQGYVHMGHKGFFIPGVFFTTIGLIFI